MSTRDELANIENKILEKKIAEKKKEELRKKNIAVSFVTMEKNNFANADIFSTIIICYSLDVWRLKESTKILPTRFRRRGRGRTSSPSKT